MIIKCIIVEDEPIARDLLRSYIAQVPYLSLVAECTDAFEAMQVLNKQSIDMVLLDINMPGLTGLEMLKLLKKYPAIIITSAYPQFALEGYELSVTDYLLKPFSFARFVQAAEKVLHQNNTAVPSIPVAEPEEFMMIKSDKKLTKVFFADILYVEAYGNYVFIHRQEGKIISKQTLLQLEAQLPADKFVRIHKSFIVSLKAIQFLEANELSVSAKKLPVGKVYREGLLKKLK